MADLYKLVPPVFANPIHPASAAIFIFLKDNRLTEIKYVEKGVIIQDMDR
jgi:hypothetical protein